MEHLMNRCTVSNYLWDSHFRLFEHCHRNHRNIVNTIANWPRKPYQNLVVNYAWLSVGFLLWNIWKARNGEIFKAESRTPTAIWEQTTRNIRETILTERWKDEDWQVSQMEEEILKRLEVN